MVAALETYFAPFEAKGVKILGPAAAPLARLRREYRFQFVLKSPQRARAGEGAQRLFGFLRVEGNSGNGGDCGRGSGVAIVTGC